MKKTLLTVLSVALLTSLAHADIEWDSKEVTVKAGPFDEFVEAVFKFTNKGEAPVNVLDVKTSCGCTTAALAKKVYAPGETGEIKAKFNVGGRKGLQSKTINVTTDIEKDPITTLMLKTEIPELLKIEPQTLVWKVGEEGAAKTIKVSVVTPEAIKLVTVTTVNDKFKSELVTLKEGKEYEVKITPPSTATADKAVFTITIDKPTDRPKTFMVVGYVR